MFSPKQKELFKKRLEGLPLTKTEQEYYSRSVNIIFENRQFVFIAIEPHDLRTSAQSQILISHRGTKTLRESKPRDFDVYLIFLVFFVPPCLRER
jgi:hypothetical protein